MEMLGTVNDITKRLIKNYESDKIILYGSYGTERYSSGGDIDLTIDDAVHLNSIYKGRYSTEEIW